MVPSGLYGQGYVVLSSSNTSISDDTVLAGPAIVDFGSSYSLDAATNSTGPGITSPGLNTTSTSESSSNGTTSGNGTSPTGGSSTAAGSSGASALLSRGSGVAALGAFVFGVVALVL